jgi:hypothetical protein
LILVAGNRPAAARQATTPRPAHGWTLNPAYAAVDGDREFELRFPSAFYAEEFADSRRYLPDRVRLPQGWADLAAADRDDGRVAELVARHVLLDLPERYL